MEVRRLSSPMQGIFLHVYLKRNFTAKETASGYIDSKQQLLTSWFHVKCKDKKMFPKFKL